MRLIDVSAGYVLTDGSNPAYEYVSSIFYNIADPAYGFQVSSAASHPTISEPLAQIESEEESRYNETMVGEVYGPGTSKLYLKTGSKSECYKLIRMDGTVEFQELLGPNQKKTMSFPCGKYELKIAAGDEWISDEEAFGPAGDYDTTGAFVFEAGESYQITTSTTGNIYGDSQDGFTGGN